MWAKIVVDLGFGDGGKGAAIDGLAMASENPIGIRFSGGHQCGHTVYTHKDRHHIHASFSSVALRGYPTYVTGHCCVYPPFVEEEAAMLAGKGGCTDITFHPQARVTTPYDIAWNRMTEGLNRHGSVGLGIGATMARNDNTGYKLIMLDLTYHELFLVKLKQIEKYYLDRLLKEYPTLIDEFMNIVQLECPGFLKSSTDIERWCKIANYEHLFDYNTLLFEGSQGLMLDMNHGIFPNVTYSNTSSRNALEICMALQIQPEIYYVTRCYSTRHGNGWMPNEGGIALINTEAEINVYDEWQKEFRVGELDYELLNYALAADGMCSSGIAKYMVVCCLDQRPGFKFDTDQIKTPIEAYFYRASPVSTPIVSRGPWIGVDSDIDEDQLENVTAEGPCPTTESA